MLCNCHVKALSIHKNHFQLCREHECRVRRNVFHVQLFRICGQYYFCFQRIFSGSRSPLKAPSCTGEVKLNRNRNECIRLLVFHVANGNPLIPDTVMYGRADMKIKLIHHDSFIHKTSIFEPRARFETLFFTSNQKLIHITEDLYFTVSLVNSH